MSLINQMLQDLESRRATLSGDAGMPHDIRSLPPQRAALPWTRLIIGAVLVLLAGVGVWWVAETQTGIISAPPAPVAVSPVVVPIVPAPAVAPTAPPPAEAPPASPPPVAAADAQQAPAAPAADEMKTLPPPPPLPSARAESVGDPVRPAKKENSTTRKSPEDRKAGLRVATSLGQVPPAEGSAAADETRIEKKMRTSTPSERAENEYRRALGLVNQGRIQEGTAVLRGALSEDTGHAGARLALFGLLVEQQRLEEAQTLLEVTLARDPAQPQMASRLARLKLERGDVQGAEATLGKTAGAATGNPEYRALHAAVLQRLTFHKKAIEEYQAALRLAPQAGVWWMGLGLSLEADGRLPEARDAYQRARATGALTLELSEFVDQKLKRLQ